MLRLATLFGALALAIPLTSSAPATTEVASTPTFSPFFSSSHSSSSSATITSKPSSSKTSSGTSTSSSAITTCAPNSHCNGTSIPSGPFVPPGGLQANFTPPQYVYMSDFDFQSLNLVLNQEYIEEYLFHYGLAHFTPQEFEEYGITPEDQYLIQFMAEQEKGHAIAVNNLLQERGAKPCTYRFPFNTVREFIEFNVKLTRWGEAGVYGFLEQLNSRPAAQILLQSITTEARQQMIFRQFEGLFPMPYWFTTGITQSMAWTLLSPYLVTCPAENPRIEWQIFPSLNVTDAPTGIPYYNTSIVGNQTTPAITHNRTIPLTEPGRVVNFSWELPGKITGYNNSYTTNTTAGAPKFVAWISQLNVTYTPLDNIKGTTGSTVQPFGRIFGDDTAPIINGTLFLVLVDCDPYVTPFNLSILNQHVVAGPAVYIAG